MPKLLLWALVALLAGCQPVLNHLQGAQLDRSGNTITLKNLGPEPMTGDLSQQAPENAIALFVRGPEAGPPECKEAGPRRFYCYLSPRLEPGQGITLEFRGDVGYGSATYYRPGSGPQPFFLQTR